jgi:hypothetical protein
LAFYEPCFTNCKVVIIALKGMGNKKDARLLAKYNIKKKINSFPCGGKVHV